MITIDTKTGTFICPICKDVCCVNVTYSYTYKFIHENDVNSSCPFQLAVKNLNIRIYNQTEYIDCITNITTTEAFKTALKEELIKTL